MTKEEYNLNSNICKYCGKEILCDDNHKVSYIRKRKYCNRNCYLNYCKTIHKKIGIYQIKNLANNKTYIGQSVDIEQRWRCHKSDLNNNQHGNEHLQRSWNKYSCEMFEFSILEECDISKLDELENKYIILYNTTDSNFGYNIEIGGNLGKRISEETRRKISENHADISGEKNPFYGKKHTQESINKYLSHPNYINRKVKGEDSCHSVITEKIAYEIKKYFSDGHKCYKGEVKDIASKYGVNPGLVSHIKNGHAWNWLKL